MVDEDGAVAAVPIQRNQPVRSDKLSSSQVGQVLVNADASGGGSGEAARWNLVFDVPCEYVANT